MQVNELQKGVLQTSTRRSQFDWRLSTARAIVAESMQGRVLHVVCRSVRGPRWSTGQSRLSVVTFCSKSDEPTRSYLKTKEEEFVLGPPRVVPKLTPTFFLCR
jgi:hypothetical protein